LVLYYLIRTINTFVKRRKS